MLITRNKSMDLLDFKKIRHSIQLRHCTNIQMLYGNVFFRKFNINDTNQVQSLKTHNLLDSYIFETRQTSSIYSTVIVAGLGGTGTCFLSLEEAIISSYDPWCFKRDYYFYDPDIVEPKNLERQIFSPELLYQPKLTCLLNFNFNHQNVYMRQKIFTKEEFYNNVDKYRGDVIILGFTDSIQFRREMVELLDEIDLNQYSNIESITYIDSGNSVTSGQVIKSFVSKTSKIIPDTIRRLCMQEEITTLSCAEIEQTFFANLFASIGAYILLKYGCVDEVWFDYQNLANNYIIAENKLHYVFNFNRMFDEDAPRIEKWTPPIINLETNCEIQGNEFEYLKEVANISKLNDFIELALYFKNETRKVESYVL